MNRCYYLAKWGMPQTNLRHFSKEDQVYKSTWIERGFYTDTITVDLSKKSEARSFSCKDVSYLQIKIEKGWKDVLLELIPYYTSHKVTVFYLKNSFLHSSVDNNKGETKNSDNKMMKEKK
jgi:hypothetical protein